MLAVRPPTKILKIKKSSTLHFEGFLIIKRQDMAICLIFVLCGMSKIKYIVNLFKGLLFPST